jgi:heme/copper-type cytochrome/quinol oxidase subunit 2
MEDWLIKHMHGVLVTIEILWVAGFLVVFVVYFIIKYRLRHKKTTQQIDESKN